MTAADLTAIREAALAIPIGDDDKWGERRRDEILAVLDRIEADTLTPRDARHLLVATGIRGAVGCEPTGVSHRSPVVAKLERIAGDTGEAKELPPGARWALETLADRIERDERRPDPPRLTPRDFG